MRLGEFIARNQETIAREWVLFAATIKPNAVGALQDHIAPLLEAVAADIESAQSEFQRGEKSRGRSDDDGTGVLKASHLHAIERAAQKFSIEDLVAEFRALRATVTRLWSDHLGARLEPQDVEDVVRFNESIDQLLAESVARFARDVQDARDLFLAILGHDLRNPLGAIKNFAEALKCAPDPSTDTVHEVASRIAGSADKTTAMVNGLLDVARTRFGKSLPISCVRTELRTLCQDVVDESCAVRPEMELRFFAPNELWGEWDPVRLSQVLSNLIGNAVQHGDMTKPVSVTLDGDREEVVILVHNYGPTISAEAMATIFNPFARNNEGSLGSSSDGLGLGLYIARQIALAHGGTIEVSSSDVAGTSFVVRLPCIYVPPT